MKRLNRLIFAFVISLIITGSTGGALVYYCQQMEFGDLVSGMFGGGMGALIFRDLYKNWLEPQIKAIAK